MRSVIRPAPLQLASSSFSAQGVSSHNPALVFMSILSESPMSSNSSRHSFIEMDCDEYTTDDDAGTPIYISSPVPPSPSSATSSLKKQRRRRGFPPPRPLSPVREADDDDNDNHHNNTTFTISRDDSRMEPASSSDDRDSTHVVDGETILVLLPTPGDGGNYYRRPSLTDDLGETDEIQAEMSYVVQKRRSLVNGGDIHSNSRRASGGSISTLSEFPIPPPTSTTSTFIIGDSSPMLSSESDDDDEDGEERGQAQVFVETPEFDLDELDAIVVGDAKQDGGIEEEDILAEIPMFPGSGSRLSMIPGSPSFLSSAFLHPRRAPLPPPPPPPSAFSSPVTTPLPPPPSTSTSLSSISSTSSLSSSSSSSPPSSSCASPITLPPVDVEIVDPYPYDEPLVSPRLRSRNHGDWRRAIDDMYALSNAKVIDALSQSQIKTQSTSRPSSPSSASSAHTFGKQHVPKLKNSRSVPSLRSASPSAATSRSSEDSTKTTTASPTSTTSSTATKTVFPDQKYTGSNYTYYSREPVPSPTAQPHSRASSSSSTTKAYSPTPRAGTPTPHLPSSLSKIKRGTGTGVAMSGIEEPAAKAYAVLGLGVLDHSTTTPTTVTGGKKWHHLGFGSTVKRPLSPVPPPASTSPVPTTRTLPIPNSTLNKKTPAATTASSRAPTITLRTTPTPTPAQVEREQRARGPSSASMTSMASSRSTQSSSSGSSGASGLTRSSSRSTRSSGSSRVMMPTRKSIPLELLIRG